MRLPLILIVGSVFGLFCGGVDAGVVMYGGLGGHGGGQPPSANDGALVTVDQASGAVTLVGHPAGVARLTGIAFDSAGRLLGSTLGDIPFPPPPSPSTSSLVLINPDTGELISQIGPITEGAGGPAISIADLAEQPGTGTLYGVRTGVDALGGQGILYRIDPSTAVATRVGSTGRFFASIAFSPAGDLYMTAADLGPAGAEINPQLLRLDPSTASVLSRVNTGAFYGALGVRPTDGTIFAWNGDGAQIFTLDPATGAATALPQSTGNNFVGDLDFRPAATAVPLPAAFWMAAVTLGGWLGIRRLARAKA